VVIVGAPVGLLPLWLALGVLVASAVMVGIGHWRSTRSRSRALRRPRGFIEWSASGEPFTFVVTRPAWPPFFSVLFFRPRVRLTITNDGPPIDYATITLEVARYDGPIGEAPGFQGPWTDTEHHEIGAWPSGVQERRVRLTIRSRSLPHAGTYVARIRVSRMQDSTPPDVAAKGGRVYVGTGQEWIAVLAEYFRVEPTSTVLTFWAVVGTLGAAVAALAAALVALVR